MSLSFYKEIDEFLGMRQGRYFGDGYLKTRQTVSNFNITGDDAGMQFTCSGAVSLPELWSKKGSTTQTPHLSTIDVVELALQCVENLLSRTLLRTDIPSDLIRAIEIIAGNAPIEGDLSALPIQGQVRTLDTATALMELQIANMAVSVTFGTEIDRLSRSLSYSRQPVNLGYVMMNKDEVSASAIVSPEETSQDETWSLASCFACALQLGQLLLYRLDDVERANSNTLWMKRTKISLSHRMPALSMAQPIYTRLDGLKRYTKADGDWRRADVFAILCNTNIVCSVTHKLPVPLAQ